MKKTLTILIVFSLVLSLGACSLFGEGKVETTAPAAGGDNASANETTAPKENPNAPKVHTITITDEEGNGIEGIQVQIVTSSDGSAGGGRTDENGVLTAELIKGKDYGIKLMAVPDEYAVEESYTFTELEAKIVLKAAE